MIFLCSTNGKLDKTFRRGLTRLLVFLCFSSIVKIQEDRRSVLFLHAIVSLFVMSSYSGLEQTSLGASGVHVGGVLSGTIPMRCGVPQGSAK